MVGVSTKDFDLTKEEEVTSYIEKVNPDAIIHCAAYTAVDQAEDDKENCWNVNVKGTTYIAQAAKKIGAKFMYISTDYVFDGQGEQPFEVTDETTPTGYYGQTKLAGEKAVQELLDHWFIVRISWVFGINGKNFVKTMLRLAETKEELNVVGDQFGSPTYTFDLARLLIDMIQTDKYGTYLASNEGVCTWAEFAEEIFAQSEKDVKVNAISTEEYPTRADRPKNSRMSKQKLVDNGFHRLPDWRGALQRYLIELEQE